jgi:hypothetical protein
MLLSSIVFVNRFRSATKPALLPQALAEGAPA